MEERERVVVGRKPSEEQFGGIEAGELAAMKAAAAAAGDDTEVFDQLEAAAAPAPAPKQREMPSEFLDDEFEIPTEEVLLPSKGVFYASGQDSVTIKYLTAEAEDIIFDPQLIKSGRVLDVVLSEGIVKKPGQLDIDDMLVADRNAIIVELRKSGLDSDYKLGEKVCSNCGEKHSPVIDLDDIKHKAISEIPDSEGMFTVTLPVTKKVVKFRLLDGKDEKYLSKVSSKTGKNVKYSKSATSRNLRQIMSVNGNEDKTYINKFTRSMPMKDSKFLREYIRLIEPGLDLNITYECVHCGHLHEEEIILDPIKLFYPDIKS